MSGREWKPGDVALVNDCTRPDKPWRAATCNEARTPECETVWILHDNGSRVWGSVSKARPLVVIDPEDRETVKRLDDAMQRLLDDATQPKYLSTADLMAEALRSLLAPPVEEPQGVGAVVEDQRGEWWVRDKTTTTVNHWKRARGEDGGSRYPWSHIAVVRILSPGVTA